MANLREKTKPGIHGRFRPPRPGRDGLYAKSAAHAIAQVSRGAFRAPYPEKPEYRNARTGARIAKTIGIMRGIAMKLKPIVHDGGGRGLRLALGALVSFPGFCAPAFGQDAPVIVGPVYNDPDDPAGEEQEEKSKKHRILPIFAAQAEERGIELPKTFGIGAIYVDDTTPMIGDGLALSGAVGEIDPPTDLIDIDSVSVRSIENRITSKQLQFDFYLLPFLNLFVAAGEVKGTVDVALDIDLDELLPPLYCRFNECGVQPLVFSLPVNNKTTTFGATAAYGGALDRKGNQWFVAMTLTRTVSVSSKERSNIHSKSGSLRSGMRFKIGKNTMISPYLGVSHLNLDTDVVGLESSSNLLPSQDRFSLRYQFEIDDKSSWSGIVGGNLELNKSIHFQAEYANGGGAHRLIASTKFRF